MAIRFVCQCGKSGNAKDELAGKRVKCPACGDSLLIPQSVADAKATQATSTGDDLGDLSNFENTAVPLESHSPLSVPMPGQTPAGHPGHQAIGPGTRPVSSDPSHANSSPRQIPVTPAGNSGGFGPGAATPNATTLGGFTASELNPTPNLKKSLNFKLWVPVGVGIFCVMLLVIAGTIVMWRISFPSTDLIGHDDAVFYVAYSADGKRLASASRDNTIKIWNVETGQHSVSIDHPLAKIAISPDGSQVAVASSPVKIYDASNGDLLEELELRFSDKYQEWEPEYVAFAPNGKFLVCSGTAGLKLWDLSAADHVQPTYEFNTRASIVAFSPDSSLLVCADGQVTNRDSVSSNRVEVFDTETGEELDGFNALPCELTITDLAFSPDGKYLGMVTANTSTFQERFGSLEEVNAEVYVWDVRSRDLVTQFETRISQLWSIGFVDNGQSFIVCGGNPIKGTKHGIVKQFNTTTGEAEKTIRKADFIITCTAISPDGKSYAWATGDIDEGKSLGSMFRHASGKHTTKAELEKTMARRLETMRFAISPL